MNANHNKGEGVKAKTLLVMAGGTGGHIFPVLRLLMNLKHKGGKSIGWELQTVWKLKLFLSMVMIFLLLT